MSNRTIKLMIDIDGDELLFEAVRLHIEEMIDDESNYGELTKEEYIDHNYRFLCFKLTQKWRNIQNDLFESDSQDEEAWDSIGLYQKKVIEYAEKGFENNPKDWNHILFQNISLGYIRKNYLQKKEYVLELMDFAGNHNEKYFNADDIIKFIKHPMFLCKLGKELSYDWDIIVRYIRFNGNWINSEYIPEELRNDIKFLHWVIRWNTRSWSSLPKNTIPEQEQDPI